MTKEFVWTDELVMELFKNIASIPPQYFTMNLPYQKMAEFKESKTKKPVLFTTEDGVDVYEGDDYFVVLEPSWNWELLKHKCISCGIKNDRPDLKYFAIEANAKEYILMNKPCLSLQDLLSVWYKGDLVVKTNEQYMSSPMFQDFKELAKSKLK